MGMNRKWQCKDGRNCRKIPFFSLILFSCTINTCGCELVSSFPPTSDNYDKVIESLKSRFGRDELLVEVYVRELLGLVLQNSANNKDKPSLGSLYDRLESHMRALETLGVTTNKCAAMLLPLVESALPEELLRIWQRAYLSTPGNTTESKARLTSLMSFLQSEVENEELISIAATGFSLLTEEDKSKKNRTKSKNAKDVPTAAGLLEAKVEKKVECIFCNSAHSSADCEKAKQLSLDERREIVKKLNCCFCCLKIGHSAKKFRVPVKCGWCSRKHVLLMCPGLQKKDDSPVDAKSPTQGVVGCSLANISSCPQVYLQTLRVKIILGRAESIVRVVIDGGSQRSHVRSELVVAMGYVPTRSTEMAHSLFGGVRTTTQKHNIYRIQLSSLAGDYDCNFEVMGQDVICEDIACIKSAPWMQELQRKRITLTDLDVSSSAIDIFIGAEIAGKLLTGRFEKLSNGLTAVETYLGWTIMGKVPNSNTTSSDALIITDLFVQEASVADLWNLDVLGIDDPTHRKVQAETDAEIKKRFNESVKINNEGRYEVELPWIEDHAPLPTNREIAEKRLEPTIKRLKKDGLLNDYDQVFKDWLNEGIIEKVCESEVSNNGHYLSHRAVVKSDSSTKIRTVFDASAREKNYPALNQCLYKGPNVIELMQSITLRFRKRKLGVIADIKRAFLQISLCPRDCDFLRFLWYFEGKVQVLRHKRVVFGVSSSPFLLGETLESHLKNALKNKSENVSDFSSDTINTLMISFYVDNCVASVGSEDELERFIREATSLMSTGGFELRAWEHSFDGTGQIAKVLGLLWNKEEDTLSINISLIDEPEPERITKRIILSATHKVFDPIGFTCPVLLQPKLLLQRLWKSNRAWDDELDDPIRNDFLLWLKDLYLLKDIKIPRNISQDITFENARIHAFCDASGNAYATVVFLRTVSTHGVRVELIGARSRVAPLKGTIIPRLVIISDDRGKID